MKRRIIGILMAGVVIASTGCSSKAQATNANIVSVAESEVSESAIGTVTATVVSENELAIGTEEMTTDGYEEQGVGSSLYGSFVIYDEAQGEEIDIPLADFYPIEGEYLLNSTLPLYHTNGKVAGYALEGTVLNIHDGNEEWLRFRNTEREEGRKAFSVHFLLVSVEELRGATDIEVVTTEKTEPEMGLLASAEIKTSEVTTSQLETKPTTEKPKTEKPATATSETVEVTPEPESVVVETNKYTPEEAVAVYRSIMEANGIQWDPSIKEFASWGTGWIYLEKGKPESAGNSSVESFRMGNSVGSSWTKYYLEVTGSDEHAVYFTGWHCD